VTPATVEAVRAMVKSGQADAGLVIRTDPAAKGRPFLIISDPARAVAAPLAQARIQQAWVAPRRTPPCAAPSSR
jgi:ABC-2 type transport system permease protein